MRAVLANMYSDGLLVPKNEKRALKLYESAAEQNFPMAQHNLGYLYINEYHNLEKAKYWFKKAYENGVKESGEVLKQLEHDSP